MNKQGLLIKVKNKMESYKRWETGNSEGIQTHFLIAEGKPQSSGAESDEEYEGQWSTL